MQGELPKDVRKIRVDGVQLIPPVDALICRSQKGRALQSLWTILPPGLTWEQHRLFLIHYHWAYYQRNYVEHYPFRPYPTPEIPGSGSKLIATIPFSSSLIRKTRDEPTHPLSIQILEDTVTNEPTVVTPLEYPPYPPSSECSVESESDPTDEKSFARILRNLPDDALESILFVAIHVERPSLINPWGLEFVCSESDLFLVLNANWKPYVKKYWCRVLAFRSKDDTWSSFTKHLFSTRPRDQSKNDTVYASALLAALSVASAHTETSPPQYHRHICPGDAMVSIDGHSMSSFGSLLAVADHLKSVTSTCIVVARCSNVVIPTTPSTQETKSARLEHVFRSNQAWKDILHAASTTNDFVPPVHRILVTKSLPAAPEILRNPLFQQGDGQNMPYDDNDVFYVPNDGSSADLFMKPIGNFQDWLFRRKSAWRRQYKVYEHTHEMLKKRKISSCTENYVQERACSVDKDFWSQQGFLSFDDWMTSRVLQWKMMYSWNKRKRKRIQRDCKEVVHISSESSQFKHWLSVRRRQWRLQRRKRQRLNVRRQDDEDTALKHQQTQCFSRLSMWSSVENVTPGNAQSMASKLLSSDAKEIAIMDEIIEVEEARRRHRLNVKRIPIDISKLFDAANGIPDEIIVKCFEYLERKEHLSILSIDKGTSKSLQARNVVWQSLCPSHWVLPRRPRKPWHELYSTRLKREHEQHQKNWDDLLVKCANVLDTSDSLCKIEKFIEMAEKSFGFDVNYISGVVCERNSLLNLAVIHRRHKVTKWLVDVKKADIETFDRGHFTPLLNAAWEGDRTLVRFFLQKGADRSVRGTQHYSKAIAPSGFEGMTADQWADQRGHPDVAKLIRLGL